MSPTCGFHFDLTGKITANSCWIFKSFLLRKIRQMDEILWHKIKFRKKQTCFDRENETFFWQFSNNVPKAFIWEKANIWHTVQQIAPLCRLPPEAQWSSKAVRILLPDRLQEAQLQSPGMGCVIIKSFLTPFIYPKESWGSPFQHFSPLEGLFWPQILPLTHDLPFRRWWTKSPLKQDGTGFCFQRLKVKRKW